MNVTKKSEYATKGAVTPKQAAAFLSVSVDTIYKLIKKKKLPSFPVESDMRIPKVALERYITDRITVPDTVGG